MSGVGENKSPDTPPVKTYRCVACSATFVGLASLLVHQASHASDFSAPIPSSQTTCSSCGLFFAHRDILKQHVCPVSSPSSSVGPSQGDSGEENKEFIRLTLQKKSHTWELKQNHKELDRGAAVEAVTNSLNAMQSPPKKDTSLISTAVEQPLDGESSRHHQNVSNTDEIVKRTLSKPGLGTTDQITKNNIPKQDPSSNEGQNDPSCIEKNSVSLPKDKSHSCVTKNIVKSRSLDQMSESVNESNQLIEPVTHYMPSNNNENTDVSSLDVKTNVSDLSDSLASSKNVDVQSESRKIRPSRNKALMRILANAYMSVKRPDDFKEDQSRLSKHTSRQLRSPRKSLNTIHSPKHGAYKKLPSQKPTSSVTRRYCPVVLLETRQQFFGNSAENGKSFQCGLCRRLFGNSDDLVLHHASHKKEQVKSCLHCHMFIISTSSNIGQHICPKSPPATPGTPQGKILLGSPKESLKANNLSKEVLKLKMPQNEKSYPCLVCKRSYTRLYNLKKHNCNPKLSSEDTKQEPRTVSLNNGLDNEMIEMVNGSEENSVEFISTGVGTDPHLHVKKEAVNPDSVDEDQLQLQTNIENPIEGRINKSNCQTQPLMTESSVESELTSLDLLEKYVNDNPTVPAHSVEPIDSVKPIESDKLDDAEGSGIDEDGDDNDDDNGGDDDDGDAGVDDDDDEEEDHGGGGGGMCLEDDGETSPTEAEIDVLIEADEDEELNNIDNVAVPEVKNQETFYPLSEGPVKRFSCRQCHKQFTRNYGLKKHMRICGLALPYSRSTPKASKTFELQKSRDYAHLDTIFSQTDNLPVHKASSPKITAQNDLSESYKAPQQDNVFVLPPLPAAQSNSQASHSQDDNNDQNWGIMSLPSVLPRKVTCECGSAFTCPRRLFGHLQMHAQETYICRQCGESVQSWAKFESHMRLHAQSQSKPVAKEKPQQHIVPPYQLQQPYPSHSQQPVATRFPGQLHENQSFSCPRCFKTFKTRRNLVRHMKRSCRVDAPTPKRFTCSRCGMSFLSVSTLTLHMQSNTCTPTANSMHCPVCAQQFTSVEGLKRHLVVHSEHKVFSCRMCPQSFSDPNDLEDHKKCVHSDDVDDPEPQRQQTREGSQNTFPKYFRCHLCTKVYHSMMALKVHRRRTHGLFGESHMPHSNDNLRGMQSSETLRVVQNSQLNFYRCQICQRAYHSLQSLKNHRRRVHRIFATGQPMSKQESFGGTQNNLASNIYRCQICPRAYPTVKAWRNHRRRVHRVLGGGPEMPTDDLLRSGQVNTSSFSCPSCPRVFLTSHSLKEHQSKMHSILGGMLKPQKQSNQVATDNSQPTVFPCQICDRIFFNLQSLKDHRRKVHQLFGAGFDVIKIE